MSESTERQIISNIPRGDVRERIEMPVRIAARDGTLAGSIDKTSGNGQFSGIGNPPQVTTGVAEDGSTIYPMIWGVDNWDENYWTSDES